MAGAIGIGTGVVFGGLSGTPPSPSPAVPDAFVIGEWTLTNPATTGDLLVTISSLPANNGATITDVEYRLDSGSWVSSGGTTTFTISGLTDTVEYDVELQAVNSVGDSGAGDLKSETPTVPSSTVPATIGSGDWTLTAGSVTTRELTINLSTLPDDGGETIDGLWYDVESSGVPIEITATPATSTDYDIVLPLSDTEYDVRIFCTNSVGSGAYSALKSQTTPAGVPEVMIGSDWHIVDPATNGDLTVTIDSAPANGGSAITDYEYYHRDKTTGGAWTGPVSAARSTPGDFTISGLTNDAIREVKMNAKNTHGSGVDSNIEEGTPTAAVPDAFVVGEWTLTDPATTGDLLVTISSLPADNGTTITDIEYRLDGGSWVSSGGTTTFTISGLTDTTEYDVELQAVSSAGDSGAGDLKSETPTAPASGIAIENIADLSYVSDWGTTSLSYNLGLSAAGSGDLIVVIMTSSNEADVDHTTFNNGTWAEDYDLTHSTGSAGTPRVQVFTKTATGTETDTLTATRSTTSSVTLPEAYIISGASGDIEMNDTELATTGIDEALPPAITPSWGSAECVFIVGWSANNWLDGTGKDSDPSGYTQPTFASDTSSSTNRAVMTTASKIATVTTETPAKFDYGSAAATPTNNISWTIAVEPS